MDPQNPLDGGSGADSSLGGSVLGKDKADARGEGSHQCSESSGLRSHPLEEGKRIPNQAPKNREYTKQRGLTVHKRQSPHQGGLVDSPGAAPQQLPTDHQSRERIFRSLNDVRSHLRWLQYSVEDLEILLFQEGFGRRGRSGPPRRTTKEPDNKELNP